MVTLAIPNELEYYKRYQYDDGEIPLNTFTLDESSLAEKMASGLYPTPTVLADLQRKQGEVPRDPKAKNVAPFPPRRRKEEIFDPAKFADLDKFAKSLLPEPQESIEDFAARLFKGCSSNLEKVRAAFYFACNAVVSGMKEMKTESQLYSRVRKHRTKSIFKKLISCGDVPYQQIKGLKKGADYQHGFRAVKGKASWIACYVEGEWRFVDPQWASEVVPGFNMRGYAKLDEAGNAAAAAAVQKPPGKRNYQCDEYYFLTDPDKLILTHFPKRKFMQWQLLPRLLTKVEYHALANFFAGNMSEMSNYQLVPVSHPLGVIAAPPGTIEIQLKETGDEKYDYKTEISIHAKSINDKTRAAVKNQANINGCVSKMTRMSKDTVKFKFVPPCCGKFLLSIYLTKAAQEQTRWIRYVDYVIHSPQAAKNPIMLTMGSKLLMEFGAGAKLALAGLTSDEPGDIKESNGERRLVLRSVDQKEHYLGFQLIGAADKLLPPENILSWNAGTGTNIVFLSPDSGSYALVVQDGGKPVCQFLLNAYSEFRDARHFSLPDVKKRGGLGLIDKELRFFIQLVSHLDPYVVCDEATLELKFTTQVQMEVQAKMAYFNSDSTEVVSDNFVITSSTAQGFSVVARFRIPGHYFIRINVRNSGSEPWRHYWNYLVRAQGQLDGSAEEFPEVGDAWNSCNQLVQPIKAILPENEAISFVLEINDPKVSTVYLADDTKTERVLLNKDNKNIWRGSLEGYKNSADALLLVKVMGGPDADTCKELLRYRYERRLDREIRSGHVQKAAELNKKREETERLRKRKQENYERQERGLELLPEDPRKDGMEHKKDAQEAERLRAAEELRRRADELKRLGEEMKRRKEEEDVEMKKHVAEEAKRRREEEEENRRRMEEEAKRRREEEEENRRRMEEEAKKRKEEEEENKRRMEEGAKKRADEEESKRRKEEDSKKQRDEEDSKKRTDENGKKQKNEENTSDKKRKQDSKDCRDDDEKGRKQHGIGGSRKNEEKRRKDESHDAGKRRDETRLQTEESEAKRQEEKRRKRQDKEKRQQEELARQRRAKEDAKVSESMRDQLALRLHRDPSASSREIGDIVDNLKKKEKRSSEDEALLLLAERTKQVMQNKQELEQETKRVKKSGDSRNLQSLVSKVESSRLSHVMLAKLEPELSNAKRQIRDQEWQVKSAQRKRQQPQVELNQRSITELSGRNAIGLATHTTVQAALLLLGHCEMETQSWKRSRILLRKSRKQFESVDPKDIHPEIAARSRQLLDTADKLDMSVVMPSLHEWTLELVSMVENRAVEQKVEPATGKRQLKLLGVTDDEVEGWVWKDKYLG